MGSNRTQQRKPHLNRTSSRSTLGLQKSANTGNKRGEKNRVRRARKKQQRNDGQAFMRRAQTTATLSTKRLGAQRTRTQYGAVASRLPSNAETERCTSGTKVVHSQPMRDWELEGRDAIFFPQRFIRRRACLGRKSSSLRLKPSRCKAEVDRLQAELGLRAERQYRAWNGKWAQLVDGGTCSVFFRFVL